MTVLILLAAGVTTLIGRFRGGLIALSAVLLVLLMDTGEWEEAEAQVRAALQGLHNA
jgi:hypothetical protein